MGAFALANPMQRPSSRQAQDVVGLCYVGDCAWITHPEVETAGPGGATMNLPGETEAGSAGTQPCRGIAWRAHRDDERSAEAKSPRSSKNPHRIGRPRCLENPRPKGGILTSGERPLSISG